MFQIRMGAFETNSSSTNSISICMQSDYLKWKNGELYLMERSAVNYTNNSIRDCVQEKDEKLFMTYDELAEMASRALGKPKDELSEEDIFWNIRACSYKDFEDNFGGEFFERTFTTPSGETVVAFGSWEPEH